MPRGEPSVGIGVPVYNNAKHIRTTLDSILSQTHENLAIYLADDCSTDGTDEICRSYAERDPRIRFTRNETNIGPADNHRKVLDIADTEYFMFARGHEILSPTIVRDCLDVLETESDVVLAFARTKWIDEDDNVLEDKPISYFDTRGLDVVARSALVFWGRLEYFYGLTLTRRMKQVRAVDEVVGHDLVMLLEMALLGSFAVAGTGVRYRRYHYEEESYSKRIRRYQKISFRRLKLIDRLFPLARLPVSLLRSVADSDLSAKDKAFVFSVVLANAPIKYLVARGKQL